MGKKLTTEEFIEKAVLKHGNKFDYSLSKYINSITKIKIICPIHGKFEQLPKDHYTKGCGCHKCGGTKKLTTKEFIEKAEKIHGNTYDYSLVKYHNSQKKIIIKCLSHGNFTQSPANHLFGRGCKKCANEGNSKRNINDSKDYILQLNKIHNSKYDYSKFVYINCHTKAIIICPEHGEFTQMPHSHLSGKGCFKCGGTTKLTLEEFKKKSNLVHENKYNYDNVVYKNNRIKIKIICPIHNLFEQTPISHMNGSGCPKCKCSKGEKKVENFLIKENIKFIQQKKFNDCIGISNKLPFDFYLQEYNICIEYDGAQHFTPFRYNEDCINKLKQLQKNDQIKTTYCLNNNIKLIRIPYWDFKNIEEILGKRIIS